MAPEDPTPREPDDLESLIAHALTLDAAERDAAIERFCRAHPSEDAAALRAAVATELRSRSLADAPVASPDPAQHLDKLKALSPPSGRYHLQGEVSRGGMGVILRVHDETLGRPLAMKVILGQSQADGGSTPPVDGRVLARFLDEAQVTGQLDHPGVVPVHELGLDASGRVYFTMRLIKGRTADEVFALARRRQDGWTLTRALEVVLKVCDTLAYAHQKGVIHRDLKPANVMVGRFGEVYVMDWGLARVLGQPDRRDLRLKPQGVSHVQTERSRQAASDPDSPIMTMDGAVVGTPSFMPPEQAAGKIDELGPRSDVYAVGAMLYVLLTGRQPYAEPGAAMSPYTILGLVLHGRPVPIHQIDQTAPAELVAVCEKAMAREPSTRYADTRALAEDLRAFLENRVVKAHRTGAVAELRAWVRRNRGVAASLAALLMVGIGALVWISIALADAREARTLERGAKELAQSREAEAKGHLARFQQLAAVITLRDLKRANARWPELPEHVQEMGAWLAQARALTDKLPEFRVALEVVRQAARTPTAEEATRVRKMHPRHSELAEIVTRLEQIETEIAYLQGKPNLSDLDRRQGRALTGRAKVERERRDALQAEIDATPVWLFDRADAQFVHDTMDRFVTDLESFLREDVENVTTQHDWARRVRKLSIDDHREEWRRAIEAIKQHPRYRLTLEPQFGLVPIGPDADSGLWEFVHLRSGREGRAIPQRGPDGKLTLDGDTGTVLVLIPGGRFTMGAQADDENAGNYDRHARSNEGAPEEVTLAPYFIAKHEMTRVQWARLGGFLSPMARSRMRSESPLLPATEITCRECVDTLSLQCLQLPTQAQWEHACRAGTDTPWWTGANRESLASPSVAANLWDVRQDDANPARREARDDLSRYNPDWKSPIGKYRANPFGLHDVHGNVWEWCLDRFGQGGRRRAGDGLELLAGDYGVCRGGCYNSYAVEARCSSRHGVALNTRTADIGVRPARAIQGN